MKTTTHKSNRRPYKSPHIEILPCGKSQLLAGTDKLEVNNPTGSPSGNPGGSFSKERSFWEEDSSDNE